MRPETPPVRRWYRSLALGLGLLALHCLPSCPKPIGEDAAQAKLAQGGRLSVVCTIGMISDVAQAIGGEQVEVRWMMGPGVDPHLYKAKPSDISALAGADLVFYNGLHLEAKLGEVLRRLGGRIRTEAVTESMAPERLLAHPDYPEQHDPHVWFDVTLWRSAARAVHDALCEVDPGHRDYYGRRAAEYLAQLDELDAYVLREAARVPEANRVLVTAHDAFSYFGRRYGFEVHGLQGVSTQSEAGTGDVQALVDFVVERRIPALFVESSVPMRNIEAVQAAARAKGWQVGIGGELFSDAMGDVGTPEGTYSGMIRHNINTIVSALLGEPEP